MHCICCVGEKSVDSHQIFFSSFLSENSMISCCFGDISFCFHANLCIVYVSRRWKKDKSIVSVLHVPTMRLSFCQVLNVHSI